MMEAARLSNTCPLLDCHVPKRGSPQCEYPTLHSLFKHPTACHLFISYNAGSELSLRVRNELGKCRDQKTSFWISFVYLTALLQLHALDVRDK
jgi:hypothetical protein